MRTIRCRRSCAAIERCSTAYCSLTSRANAFSVTAMNGMLVGHLEEREVPLAGGLDQRLGDVSCAKPVPTPEPGEPVVGQPRDERPLARPRRRAAIPVVSSSSPPDSHGVGSGSSEMCTQRTGASSCASPAEQRDVEVPAAARGR